MAKYNRTQVKFILGSLKQARRSRWNIEADLRKKYTPKKPKCVLEYEKKCVAASERAESEAMESSAKADKYIADIERMLILQDTDFDLEAAIEELKSI